MVNKPMTWEDLSNFYHERTGRQARVRPMDEIFEWAAQQPDVIMNKDGSLSRVRSSDEDV